MPSRKSPTTTYSEHIAALKELRRIPGVGPHIAQDLVDQGFRRVAELQGCDPQRCAVYFAQTPNPDPVKLKWWNWQDRP